MTTEEQSKADVLRKMAEYAIQQPGTSFSAAHIMAMTPERTIATCNVLDAAVAYVNLSHGNLRGDRYRERREARDRLSDALEAWEDVPWV